MRSRLAGVATLLLLLATVIPLWFAFVSSLTPEQRLFEAPSLLPRGLVLDHYRALLGEHRFFGTVRNSLVVAAATTLLCLALGAPCAYALARLRFAGRRLLLAVILVVNMFPQIAIVSPLYLVLRRLHLINTYPGLVLPYVTFAMPLAVWLLVGFFRQIPAELERAAIVDGAGRLRVFVEIFLPLALPAVATTAILTFVYCWNEFLFALSFTTGPSRQTVPVGLALMRGQYRVPWGEIFAASLVATAPVVLLVLAFQRRIVQGLTSGALKG